MKKFHGNLPVGNDLKCDPNGNIFVLGNFTDTLRLDPTLLVGYPVQDIFFAKLNTSGKVIYTQSFGNSKSDYGKKVIIQNNTLLIGGSFCNGIKLGAQNLHGGENTCFIATFDITKSTFTNAMSVVEEVPEYLTNMKVTNINGKLLRGKDKDKDYLSDQGLYIEDAFGNMIRRTVTDENGDFSFKNIDVSSELNLVLEKNELLKETDEIYLAQQNGIIVEKIEIGKDKKFKYKLIPAILSRLESMEVDENITLKFKEFKTSKESNELNIVERISYEPNSFAIPADAVNNLTQIATYLRQNPKTKIEISSHTDANGEEAANLELSQKRAETVRQFLIKKQIAADRITAKGFGETQIINRCVNDVKCTDQEHSYNRRTEFKIVKTSGL